MTDHPIHQRPGYLESVAPDALQRDLGALARKHGLFGCVLVQFDRDRIGVRSWGVSDVACAGMTSLGDRILTDIDDGRHDPLEFLPPEGEG